MSRVAEALEYIQSMYSCCCYFHCREELDEEAEEGHEERAGAEGPATSGDGEGSAVRFACNTGAQMLHTDSRLLGLNHVEHRYTAY